jgi:hypothetical protein
MSWMISAQRDGSSVMPCRPLARSAAVGPEADALAEALEAPALARMNGSTCGPILVRTP